MAPSAEASIGSASTTASSDNDNDNDSNNNHNNNSSINNNNTTPKRRALSSGTLSRKTIAFAVNYETSAVDRYWTNSIATPTKLPVEPVLETSSGRTTRRSRRAIEASQQQHHHHRQKEQTAPSSLRLELSNVETSGGNANVNGIVSNPVTPTGRSVTSSSSLAGAFDHDVNPNSNPVESSHDGSNTSSSSSNSSTSSASQTRRSLREQKQRPVRLTRVRVRYDMEMVPNAERNLDGSIVWFPHQRKDWEESVSELTAVCTSAAARRYAVPGKTMIPPLSRDYIKDRIDIDDPLRGYQIRSAHGGWLQGFLMWTNFTTWTHFFTWDSKHEQSGLAATANTGMKQDTDGSLAEELQALPRHGNPSDSGIVFPNIAEIALLGGLQCGGNLLRMALEDIRKHPQYKYVALQATDTSKKFYEHFGFIRVGAVCRYGTSSSEKGIHSHSLAIPTLDTPVSGYRHWTHANEAPESLNLHGGPSYMMCLKLTDSVPETNLFDYIKPYTVEDKPLILPLGAASTPAPKPHPQPPRKAKTKMIQAASKRLHTENSSEQNTTITKRRKLSVTDENAEPKRPAKVTPKTPKKLSPTTSKVSPPSAPSLNPKPLQRPVDPSSKVQKVDRSVLCKQKVKSYPRDRAHFYNKVVQPSNGQPRYFFVLHYSESLQQLTLVPMKATGTLSGKRQGRPRFQCLVQETSANWLTAQPCSNYIPVPAFMVMKTPIVAQEAWDILGAEG